MTSQHNDNAITVLEQFKENVLDLWGKQDQQDFLKSFARMTWMLSQYINDDISNKQPNDLSDENLEQLKKAKETLTRAKDWWGVTHAAKLTAESLGFETTKHFYNVADNLQHLEKMGNPHEQAEASKFLNQLAIRSKWDNFFTNLDGDELQRWSKLLDKGELPFNAMEDTLMTQDSPDIVQGGNGTPPPDRSLEI